LQYYRCRVRVLLLTAAALIGFAANSLLTRGALGPGRIDAAAFTLIRLATGAVALAILLRIRRGPRLDAGRWESAAMLAIYAVSFTAAYTRIAAAAGALLLFGAVQVTMIGAGIARGERPRARDWTGMLLAAAGLLVLTIPGVTAPDVIGAALMVVGGICWGVYSLAGRGSRDSLASTAGNFSNATLLSLLALAWFLKDAHLTTTGVVMAAASGSLASGVCYTFWYAVLPALAAWRAALVQLIVPVLTAFGAVAFLGEPIDARLIVATALIGAGVWLSTWPSRPR
jgi:drug/metabolite transporter (DMT)-like permease